jgi:hypothetical protein
MLIFAASRHLFNIAPGGRDPPDLQAKMDAAPLALNIRYQTRKLAGRGDSVRPNEC